MKKLPLYTVVLMLGLSGCSSQKKLEKEAPFATGSPSCQEFASGRAEGGSGFILKIPLQAVPGAIRFEQVYFRGHNMEPEITEENGVTTLVCEYRRETAEGEKDFVMHADPMAEVGNQPPTLQKDEPGDFPFELKADEAVIQYRKEGKKKSGYFKISGVKEKMPVQYPSRPQN